MPALGVCRGTAVVWISSCHALLANLQACWTQVRTGALQLMQYCCTGCRNTAAVVYDCHRCSATVIHAIPLAAPDCVSTAAAGSAQQLFVLPCPALTCPGHTHVSSAQDCLYS